MDFEGESGRENSPDLIARRKPKCDDCGEHFPGRYGQTTCIPCYEKRVGITSSKTAADGEEEAPPAMPPVDMAADAPVEMPEADADISETPESPAEAKKDVILDQIDTLKDDVAALETEVAEGEDLDFSAIFDEEGMDEKTNDLANEDEFDGEEGGEEDFFGPSSAKELESSLDTDGMNISDSSDFFMHNASSSMDSLFETKQAAKDDALAPGEMADAIVSKGNVADAEEDHDGDILMDVLNDIKEVAFDNAEFKRTTEPKFEKAASKKPVNPTQVKRPIRSLGNVKTAATESREAVMLASLVFPDDETFG